MKVFISWSGDRSRVVAEALRDWLPNVIQALDPWISEDIAKGTKWLSKIDEELDKARVGIICSTMENCAATWIVFEASALAKSYARDSVGTY